MRKLLKWVTQLFLFFPAWIAASWVFPYGGPPLSVLVFAAIFGAPYYVPFVKLWLEQIASK